MIVDKNQELQIDKLVDEVLENDIRHLLISNIDTDDINKLKSSIKSITIQFLMDNSKFE